MRNILLASAAAVAVGVGTLAISTSSAAACPSTCSINQGGQCGQDCKTGIFANIGGGGTGVQQQRRPSYVPGGAYYHPQPPPQQRFVARPQAFYPQRYDDAPRHESHRHEHQRVLTPGHYTESGRID